MRFIKAIGIGGACGGTIVILMKALSASAFGQIDFVIGAMAAGTIALIPAFWLPKGFPLPKTSPRLESRPLLYIAFGLFAIQL